MEFTLFSDVVLVRDIPEDGLRKGDIGTIVERHDVVEKEPGYSMEFFDMLGKTIAVITVPASLLRLPAHSDIPAVRPVTVAAA